MKLVRTRTEREVCSAQQIYSEKLNYKKQENNLRPLSELTKFAHHKYVN